ncbi:gamma-glutamylcyclotransferase 2-3 [Canna indica]|uniref:glutathione-specific gamma-glutamylcyclotransferase n=1 Tax=Canna indica TaxID=4628 RepID=A0AAQ3L778_9LILI|nr:gamma-glutamylcyclotransferase 2-3 [Canna indica]
MISLVLSLRVILHRRARSEMVLWVFGYGSLIWKAGFRYDERRVGFIRGFRRVFYQGSTDHRGTPEFPGRTVTLESLPGAICWGVAYKVSDEEDQKIALEHLEVREKQYDMKVYVDFYTDADSPTPAINGVMLYIGSADKTTNQNYLGPAALDEMASQIAQAEGPSGPNRDYLFHLDDALKQIGCEDSHVRDLANAVRKIISTKAAA